MLYLFPIITVFIWAGNAIINKMASTVIDPGAISFYRWLVAFIVLTPFLIVPTWKNRKVILPYLSKLMFLAMLGMVLNQSLGYYAGLSTTALNLSLITSLVPLIGLFLSIPLLNQKLTLYAVFGAVISFVGLIIMLSHGDVKGLFSQGMNHGDVLVLLGTVAYALYVVLIKRWRMPISNWQSVYVQVCCALVMLLPLFSMSEQVHLNQHTVPLILYAGLLASIIAPWCWMMGIEHLGADKAAIFMNLMPAVTAVFASVILDEQLTFFHYVGMAMIIGGVILAQRSKSTRPVMAKVPQK
ncbi:DMT family transporter [Vibrio rumoiensis]|uniref:Multidrug DMT transporter n=1 Tax=Vibrio rumoiensis 1S-45 TaxID=1188252 RepID=A0A1E5E6N6_9VIBR|nr:DMT family transporter [Vibrio rumoiensis]OEF29493.1 multidrug DMT transporter [Vibrio rumoiensis 1S-45]